MKKLLILPILLISTCVYALTPRLTECYKNKWGEIKIFTNSSSEINSRNVYKGAYCILPNGEYYPEMSIWRSKSNPNGGKFKELFEQYSGKSPTFEQVEKAKKEFRKQGYIVE